jgi:hypothetical protein
MKYALLVLLLIGCKSNPSRVDLTRPEIAILDSLQFDKSIVADVKTITKQTFEKVAISNVSGKEIPANFLPKMISFKVDKSFDIKQLDDLREKSMRLGYNIYDINQEDGHITIIISKVNG